MLRDGGAVRGSDRDVRGASRPVRKPAQPNRHEQRTGRIRAAERAMLTAARGEPGVSIWATAFAPQRLYCARCKQLGLSANWLGAREHRKDQVPIDAGDLDKPDLSHPGQV